MQVLPFISSHTIVQFSGYKALDKQEYIVYDSFCRSVGVFSGEGPPVPIPNTEVKLTYADNTCLVTGREDRSTPTQEPESNFGLQIFLLSSVGRACGC